MSRSFICNAAYCLARQPVMNRAGSIMWAAMLLVLAACTHDVGVTVLPPQQTPVTPVIPLARVASIEVLPYPLLLVSGTGVLTAVLRDSAGFILVGRSVAWSSADTTIATVSNTGVVTGHAAGQTRITATSEGVSSYVPIVVPSSPSIVSVVVSPDTVSVEAGQKWQLSVTLLDSIGRYALASGPIIWTTSDSTRALVSGSGVVSAVSAGTAIVAATNSGKRGTSTIRVFPTLPVGSLTLSPDTITVQVGAVTSYTVVVKDSLGNRVFSRPVSWATSNGSEPSLCTLATTIRSKGR